jgi:hypothetical protein
MITRLQIPETIYKSHVSGQCEASAVISNFTREEI